MRAHSMPIAVLLHHRVAEVTGKCFVSNSLSRLPTRSRGHFAAVFVLCFVSCVCNLLAHPRGFEATSQDEK